jgi:hypothetical protein
METRMINAKEFEVLGRLKIRAYELKVGDEIEYWGILYGIIGESNDRFYFHQLSRGGSPVPYYFGKKSMRFVYKIILREKIFFDY